MSKEEQDVSEVDVSEVDVSEVEVSEVDVSEVDVSEVEVSRVKEIGRKVVEGAKEIGDKISDSRVVKGAKEIADEISETRVYKGGKRVVVGKTPAENVDASVGDGRTHHLKKGWYVSLESKANFLSDLAIHTKDAINSYYKDIPKLEKLAREADVSTEDSYVKACQACDSCKSGLVTDYHALVGGPSFDGLIVKITRGKKAFTKDGGLFHILEFLSSLTSFNQNSVLVSQMIALKTAMHKLEKKILRLPPPPSVDYKSILAERREAYAPPVVEEIIDPEDYSVKEIIIGGSSVGNEMIIEDYEDFDVPRRGRSRGFDRSSSGSSVGDEIDTEDYEEF